MIAALAQLRDWLKPAVVIALSALLLCGGGSMNGGKGIGCEGAKSEPIHDGHFVAGKYVYDETGSNWYRDERGACWYSGDPPDDPAFQKASDEFDAKHGVKRDQPTPAMRVYFAPGPDCENAAVELIGKAEKTIHGRAYNFSSIAIRDALLSAKHRGISVDFIVDHKALAERKCIAAELVRAGCNIYDDSSHRIAHQKTITVDARSVALGSFNWSESAKKNAEVLVIRENDKEFAAEFEKNFEEHLKEKRTTRIK